MRLSITLMLLFTASASFAQSFKPDPTFLRQAPDAVGYMLDTVAVSGLKKDHLFNNAITYVSNTYKDSRYVIESKDAANGELTFNGNARTYITVRDTSKKGKITSSNWPVSLTFKCKVFVKDDSFKIILNNLEYLPAPGVSGLPLNPFAKERFAREQWGAAMLAQTIIRDIASYMNRKPDNDF